LAKGLARENGFTLTEVLVGLVILAVGVLAIVGLQIASIRGTFFSNNLRQASVLAQNRLEFLKSLSFAGAPELTAGDHPDVTSGIFQGEYSVQTNGTGAFATIRYTVRWVEKNVSHNISFSTIKSR
jgi:prepilin-type N-terminal cleavage/methylation domain-containing protein